MWYTLAEVYDGERVVELFYGADLPAVAAKLEKFCDEMMQFDLEEMTMDEIDAYYTEGYDEFEQMIEEPSLETITALHFGCNNGKIDVLTVVEGYDALQNAFAMYKKNRLKNFDLIAGVEETEGEISKLAKEWKAINLNDFAEETLKYFTK